MDRVDTVYHLYPEKEGKGEAIQSTRVAHPFPGCVLYWRF